MQQQISHEESTSRSADVEFALKSKLERRGFNIFQPFVAQWYNDHLIEHQLQQKLRPIQSFGHKSTKAYLIGSSKCMWEPFLEWLKGKESSGIAVSDPLDSFCEDVIQECVGHDQPHQIYWSHERNPYLLVSMQRVAEISGLCYLDHTTHLAIHPKYGTWCSFRAVVSLDSPQEPTSLPQPIPCLLSDEEKIQASILLDEALKRGGDGYSTSSWQAWLAVRDLVSLGKDFRYSNANIEYNYTGERSVLVSELLRLSACKKED